jgi:hypothetical protein
MPNFSAPIKLSLWDDVCHLMLTRRLKYCRKSPSYIGLGLVIGKGIVEHPHEIFWIGFEMEIVRPLKNVGRAFWY